MKRILIGTTVSFVALGMVVGCGGSDSKSAGPAGTAGTSNDGGANGGSSNGGGGSSNAGTSNGGGGSGGGAPACNTSGCPPRTVSIVGQSVDLTACCIDATTCGYTTPGGAAGRCVSKSTIDQFLSDGGFKLPEGGPFQSEKIVLDPTCPDLQLPDGGVGGFGIDAGSSNSLQGCCDKTNVCGYAFSAKFGNFSFSQCFTQADLANAPGGFSAPDAGPSKACTYK